MHTQTEPQHTIKYHEFIDDRPDVVIAYEYYYISWSSIQLLDLCEQRGPNIVGSKHWVFASDLHRDDGPAIIYYDTKGITEREYYYVNNKLHRDNGPSQIEYYETGNIKLEAWFIDGVTHRDNKPAFIKYDESGNITNEQWYKNNRDITQNLKDAHYFNASDEMKDMIWEMM